MATDSLNNPILFTVPSLTISFPKSATSPPSPDNEEIKNIANLKRKTCQWPNCTHQARSKNLCIQHGGGPRCIMENCSAAARSAKQKLCIKHGGGMICGFSDESGKCVRAARSRSLFCFRHGGGKRCAMPSCNTPCRGKSNYCIKHGGGNKCIFAGCDKLEISARSHLCKKHQTIVSLNL